jgi:hypothetical protein
MRAMTLEELEDHYDDLYEPYEAFCEPIEAEINRLHEKVFGKPGSICYAYHMDLYMKHLKGIGDYKEMPWMGYYQNAKPILDEIDRLYDQTIKYKMDSGMTLCLAMIQDMKRCSSKSNRGGQTSPDPQPGPMVDDSDL